MAYELNFLSYCANYTARGDILVKVGRLKPFLECRQSGDACFRKVFYNDTLRRSDGKGTNESHTVRYCVRALKYNDSRKDTIDSNVIMSKKQIENFFSYAARVVPFTYTVLEYQNHFSFIIKLEKLPLFCHKFVLTWVRYLYENPFMFAAYHLDYFVDMFPKVSPIAIYHILLGIQNHCRDIHSMMPDGGDDDGKWANTITDEDLRARIKDRMYDRDAKINGICGASSSKMLDSVREKVSCPDTLVEFLKNVEKDRQIYTKALTAYIANKRKIKL